MCSAGVSEGDRSRFCPSPVVLHGRIALHFSSLTLLEGVEGGLGGDRAHDEVVGGAIRSTPPAQLSSSEALSPCRVARTIVQCDPLRWKAVGESHARIRSAMSCPWCFGLLRMLSCGEDRQWRSQAGFSPLHVPASCVLDRSSANSGMVRGSTHHMPSGATSAAGALEGVFVCRLFLRRIALAESSRSSVVASCPASAWIPCRREYRHERRLVATDQRMQALESCRCYCTGVESNNSPFVLSCSSVSLLLTFQVFALCHPAHSLFERIPPRYTHPLPLAHNLR